MYNVDKLDKGMIHVLGGMQQMVRDFVMVLRMARNLRLMNCLLMELSVSWGVTEMQKAKPWIKGYYCR